MSELHILNGEGTAMNFRKSGIRGDLMVWNEALACGPVMGIFASPPFWRLRDDYFSNPVPGINLKEEPPTYRELVVNEFKTLRNLQSYQQITLWFEYDLFCQINLLGLLSWMSQEDISNLQIDLICIDEFPGMPHFRGLGQLSSGDFRGLLDHKLRLDNRNLLFAKYAWNAYSGSAPGDLLLLEIPQQFPYMQTAFYHHLRRFPSTFNGLGAIEQYQLEIIKEHQPSGNQLISKLINDLHQWGFGDYQYLQVLSNLGPAINKGEKLTLNRLGESLLAGDNDYLDLEFEPYYLGGVLNTAFRWDGESLIPQGKSYGS